MYRERVWHVTLSASCKHFCLDTNPSLKQLFVNIEVLQEFFFFYELPKMTSAGYKYRITCVVLMAAGCLIFNFGLSGDKASFYSPLAKILNLKIGSNVFVFLHFL